MEKRDPGDWFGLTRVILNLGSETDEQGLEGLAVSEYLVGEKCVVL